MSQTKAILVIHGVTEAGATFRPSDWIDRLSSLGASYDHRQRLVYSPYFFPKMINGKRCLVVDLSLAQLQPELYAQVMQFVQSNQLKQEQFESIESIEGAC